VTGVLVSHACLPRKREGSFDVSLRTIQPFRLLVIGQVREVRGPHPDQRTVMQEGATGLYQGVRDVLIQLKPRFTLSRRPGRVSRGSEEQGLRKLLAQSEVLRRERKRR
jgi:hypothetical protein